MAQHGAFVVVVAGALLIAGSSLRPSNVHAGVDPSAVAIANAAAALEHLAGSAEAAGVEPRWSAGIASRIEQAEYRVSQAAGGLQAPNRAHNLRTQFGPGGINVGPRKTESPAPHGGSRGGRRDGVVKTNSSISNRSIASRVLRECASRT